MSKENQNNKFKEAETFVDNFIDFVSDTEGLSNKDIDNTLQQKGVDISSLIENVQQMVNQALEDDRLSWQKEALESRSRNIERFKKKYNVLISFGKKELVDRFNEIVQGNASDLSFAHRNHNPEEISEDELRKILSEYEQLGDGD